MSFFSSLRKFSPYLQEHKTICCASIVSYIFSVACEVLAFGLIVYLFQGLSAPAGSCSLPGVFIIEGVTKDFSISDKVRWLGVGIGLFTVFRGGFLFSALYLTQLVEQNILLHLRSKAFRHALGLRFLDFHRLSHGKILTLVETCSTESAVAAAEVIKILQICMLIVCYTLCMLLISPLVTSVSLLLLLGALWGVKGPLQRYIKKLGEQFVAVSTKLGNWHFECISGIRMIKLFAKQEFCIDRHAKLGAEYRKNSLRHQALACGINPLLSIVVGLLIAAMLVQSSYLYGASIVSVLPSVILFVLIFMRLSQPFQQLSQLYAEFTKRIPALQMYHSLFDKEQEGPCRKYDRPVSFSRLNKKITFDQLSFSYKKEDEPTVHNLNFSIPSGKMTAFVGPSGAGKSTIVNLLGCLLQTNKGKILVDGKDVSEMDLTSWRSKMAFVSQDNFLFNDTIRNNLVFAKPDATEEQILHACRLAHAESFILESEKGLDTMIGNNGVRISGGQQQRLAIARAVLAKPEILILDEATSNLDSLSEKAIQEAISAIRKECTMIVIAHRLSTIQTADNIVVLDQGKVVGSGTHQELYQSCSLYQQLVAVQQGALTEKELLPC